MRTQRHVVAPDRHLGLSLPHDAILVASLLAASMGPTGLAISAVATGTPVGQPFDAATYLLTSSYLCAILAAGRPASAAALSERLAATVHADAWTLDAARAWWERHQPLPRFRSSGAPVEEYSVADVVRPPSPAPR